MKKATISLSTLKNLGAEGEYKFLKGKGFDMKHPIKEYNDIEKFEKIYEQEGDKT